MSTFDYTTACRHVASETPSINCKIEGTIPSWLDGFLLFNGPGLTKIGLSEYKHVFDSSAILQRIDIKNGQVSYKTKFLQSNTFKNNEKMQAITVSEFGTPGSINKGALSRLKNAFDSEKMLSDNAVIAVLKMGANFYALGECPFLVQIDPLSLDVIKRINMYKAFSLATQSVHVIEEEEDGYYMLGQAITLTGPKYSVIHFAKDGDVEKGKVMASINARWRLNPCYIHSMTFTKNYMIIIEPPLAVSIMELLGGVMKNTPFIEGIHWQNESTIFHIFDRKTWKEVETLYVSDPFFFLHFGPVFEKDNHIVLNISAYKDASILQNMFIAKLREAKEKSTPEFHEAFKSVLTQFIIPLDVDSAKQNEELVKLPNTACSAIKTKKEVLLKGEVLSSLSFENSVFNKKYSHSGNRYVWGMGASPKGEDFAYLIKMDYKTKETKMFHEEKGYPSPFMFVPSPNAQEEDEGVILTLMLTSSAKNLVTLLILDAATLTEVARATTLIDAAVPMPIHGNFYAN